MKIPNIISPGMITNLIIPAIAGVASGLITSYLIILALLVYLK